jgi:hypothetical protein
VTVSAPSSARGLKRVRAKTNAVVEYHNDPDEPGKPLYLLIPGAVLALVCLLLEIYLAYRTFLAGDLPGGSGIGLMLLLAPFYAGAVFLFSYGYELYDVPKALRLTAIIVFTTLAAVVIVAVVFFLLGGSSKSDSKSSSSSSSSSSGSRVSLPSFSSRGGGDFFNINLGGGTVTREVVREAPVAPVAPPPPEFVPSDAKR